MEQTAAAARVPPSPFLPGNPALPNGDVGNRCFGGRFFPSSLLDGTLPLPKVRSLILGAKRASFRRSLAFLRRRVRVFGSRADKVMAPSVEALCTMTERARV